MKRPNKTVKMLMLFLGLWKELLEFDKLILHGVAQDALQSVAVRKSSKKNTKNNTLEENG